MKILNMMTRRKNNLMQVVKALLIATALVVLNCCQPVEKHDISISAKSKSKDYSQITSFFRKSDLMKIGVYYYPEQWPENEWARDFNNIAGYGFEFTHLAEFSWTFLEPKENIYDFRQLDRAIDMAAKAGLKVILCTPTLCPPAWMGIKYPEIYLTGSDGRRREHGIRANASITDSIYKNFADNIVTAMAIHYARDKRIWGWQLDNEPLAVSDFSPPARRAFQRWLQEKYGTIDKMNASWGGSFWSTRYDNFGQVLIPNEEMNVEDKLSPHAILDFRRFTADVTGRFINRQADILRKHILPNQWITTNYTNVSKEADPRRSDQIDFPTFTMYPVNGKNELGGNNFRTGIPYRIYEACDYYRPIKGVTGVMELQPGQINWGSVNPQPQPGAVKMWIMQAFGGGCSFLCTYRYRHPLWSSEMYHEGIVGTDGLTLSEGGKEFVEAINEMKVLRSAYDSTSVMPRMMEKRKTALLWSHDVMWDLDIQKQTDLWNTWSFRNTYTSAVKSAGAPMDFISENDDFENYHFLIAPAYQLIDSSLVKKWRRYAEEGGNLILTCRTGQKDKTGHFFEAGWSQPIVSLTGAEVDFFDMLPDGINGTVTYNNIDYKWTIWAEILKPGKSADVLATYSDQFYAGKAAAVTRRLGKGTVTFIGVASSDGLLERQIVRDVYLKAGVAIEDLPKGVYIEWRDGFFVASNYTDHDFTLPVKENADILTGSNPLKPACTIIWKSE